MEVDSGSVGVLHGVVHDAALLGPSFGDAGSLLHQARQEQELILSHQ